jgi:hypothetical protein
MPAPFFIHVQANGDLWISNNLDDTVAGSTNAGIFRIYPDGRFQRITTVSGTSPNVACTGATGKRGKEIT